MNEHDTKVFSAFLSESCISTCTVKKKMNDPRDDNIMTMLKNVAEIEPQSNLFDWVNITSFQ